MFTIVDLKTNKPIGAAGLLYINWIIRSADFSFYIGRNEEYIDNEGYAIEATKLLTNYGLKNLNLNKIWMELYEFDKIKRKDFKIKKDTKKEIKPKNTIENYYKVKKGDTLYSIAKKFNTTIALIIELNGLHSNTISIGQHLLTN